MDPERPERPQQPRVAPDSRERATETEYCCSASSSSTQYCSSSSSSSRCSLCCSCSCAFTSGSSSGGIVIAAEQQRPTGGSAQQETARKDDVILVDEELESQLDMDEEEEEAAQQQQSHRPARHSEQPDDRHSTSAYAERRASTTRRDCGCKDDRDVLCRRPASNDRPNLQRQQQLLQKPQKQRQRHRLATQAVRLASKASSRLGSLLPSYLATLLILSCSFVGVADACSSRSTPKPRPPTPTPRPNITFHMYSCPHDYAEWYCLNGATCFTVKIVESLLYNCLCAEGYIGQRCEFKDLDGSYLPTRQRIMLETASIAGAVTIAVFLAVITFISVYIHCKRKQKELRMSSGVDAVDGPGRDPELRPFCSRSRSLMIFMAKNPNSSTTAPSIEQTRMPNWNFPAESSTRVASVNENKRPSQ